jgi:hypothetical protein
MCVIASPMPASAGDQADLISPKLAAARLEIYVAFITPSERSARNGPCAKARPTASASRRHGSSAPTASSLRGTSQW